MPTLCTKFFYEVFRTKWNDQGIFSSLNEARVCEALDKQMAETSNLTWPLGDRKLRKEDRTHLKKQKLEKRENFYFADFGEERRATIHVISRSWETDGSWITSGLRREHITAHTLIWVQWYLFWSPVLKHCKIIYLHCFKLLFFGTVSPEKTNIDSVTSVGCCCHKGLKIWKGILLDNKQSLE